MAPYVLKTFKKELENKINDNNLCGEDIDKAILAFITTIDYESQLEEYKKILQPLLLDTKVADILEKTYKATIKQTFQAAEGFVHNMSNLESRCGSQQVFSSITYGMDTTPEGRAVTDALIQAQLEGLGHHETAIFPIAIFLTKDGVNFKKGDPNYDLYRKAMYCSAKRLWPSYVFLDAPQNLEFYKDGDPYSYAQAMGCRTKVLANVNGRQGNLGRGNVCYSTIILPQLALEAKGDLDKFFEILDKYIDMSKDYLLDRYHYICKSVPECAPFTYRNGTLYAPEKQHNVENYMRQGSLSLGFLGLSEALVALVGKHHGESAESQELGLKIVGRIREKCNEYTKEYHLNFSAFSSPAENLSHTALKKTRSKYGVIPGVTDKEYFTNSNHIDVSFPISIRDKMKLEGPYHMLTNAGNISYVELESDIYNNIDALEQILAIMKNSGVGYGAINIRVDECQVCGYSGIIEKECPVCRYDETKEYNYSFVKENNERNVQLLPNIVNILEEDNND